MGFNTCLVIGLVSQHVEEDEALPVRQREQSQLWWLTLILLPTKLGLQGTGGQLNSLTLKTCLTRSPNKGETMVA